MEKRVVKSKLSRLIQYRISKRIMRIATISYIDTYEIPSLIDKPIQDWSTTLQELHARKDALSLILRSAMTFRDNKDFIEGYLLGACITYSLLKGVVKPIPIITMENLNSALASLQHNKEQKNKEVYKRLYEEQPIFLEITSYVIDNDNNSHELKDGFCKGMAQFYDLIWRALEAQELEEMFS